MHSGRCQSVIIRGKNEDMRCGKPNSCHWHNKGNCQEEVRRMQILWTKGHLIPPPYAYGAQVNVNEYFFPEKEVVAAIEIPPIEMDISIKPQPNPMSAAAAPFPLLVKEEKKGNERRIGCAYTYPKGNPQAGDLCDCYPLDPRGGPFCSGHINGCIEVLEDGKRCPERFSDGKYPDKPYTRCNLCQGKMTTAVVLPPDCCKETERRCQLDADISCADWARKYDAMVADKESQIKSMQLRLDSMTIVTQETVAELQYSVAKFQRILGKKVQSPKA